jgi:hypothetical protein
MPEATVARTCVPYVFSPANNPATTSTSLSPSKASYPRSRYVTRVS